MKLIDFKEHKIHYKLRKFFSKPECKAADPKTLKIIFNITYRCNLECIGCCVNARFSPRLGVITKDELTFKEIVLLLQKIKSYGMKKGLNPYIAFTGGEPFLRPDFLDILQYSSSLFGADYVTFETNGTLLSDNHLDIINSCVNNFGVSIDGDEEYHNYWRNPLNRSPVKNPYLAVLDSIIRICEHPEMRKKLVITFTPTKYNLSIIPQEVIKLAAIGVKRFSIHRNMPVGRMYYHRELGPDEKEYLKLVSTLIDIENELNIDIRLHHSLEHMYRYYMLGEIYAGSPTPCSIKRSSIGIDVKGYVYFCPWLVSLPFKKGTTKSLLDHGVELEELLNEINIVSFADCKKKCMLIEKDHSEFLGNNRSMARALTEHCFGLKEERILG